MDQYLVAMLALCIFAAFVAGYFIGAAERRSRRFAEGFASEVQWRARLDRATDVHSGGDDVERRARRVQ